MKQLSLVALLFAFTFVAVSPGYALAKHGDDDRYDSEYSDDYDDDRDDDDDYDDSRDDDDDKDDDSRDDLEVEADVYTDITIVKVELANSKKTVFSTDADTRAEIVEVVAEKFNLSKSEVEAALEFEIEDRASRTQDRAKISFTNNRPVDTCDDSDSSEFEVEADVFTNTTIVKVEKGSLRKVFETTATTTEAIAEAVVAKVDGVTVTQVKRVLDIDVEDRASRASDLSISSSNDDDCDDDNSSSNNGAVKADAKLEARIAELQRLIETLMRLLTLRLGN